MLGIAICHLKIPSEIKPPLNTTFFYILSFNFRAPEDEIWKHVDFILRQDQLEGVKVFIKRQECEEQKKLPVDVGKCENVLNFLQQFPIAKMTYLEFLVKQKKLQVSFKTFN